ncbi:class I SAM-dependent methyltransferase [Hahella ganghwensis]|uniref:class I SAM-dependent methyltransferase n=1 Tax=Hahella ganghwensis TaxID=286420 RepID=UPI000373BB59|nr:class I SAM-dependent methyltransferase [Hahella ganghwensis]
MTNYYNQNADQVFSRYQSLSFEAVHGAWLDSLPASPGNALDIGAGSGRDAAWLADKGWQVTAVEPADHLRKLAKEFHHQGSIHWVKDSLPSLTEIGNRQRFDLILVSAVWMHLPPKEQAHGLDRLRQLLAPEGLLVITWRNIADETERQFYPVDESLLMGASVFEAEDLDERPGVVWKVAIIEGSQ